MASDWYRLPSATTATGVEGERLDATVTVDTTEVP